MHRCDLAMTKVSNGIADRFNIIATIINKPLNEVVYYSSLLDPSPTHVLDQSIVPFVQEIDPTPTHVLDQSIVPFVQEKNSGHWTAAEHE